jgi:hypothetical protein
MTPVLLAFHGHADVFAWLARGFASSIGWMLARAIGWPVALLVLLAGVLFLWWRKRRATRRQRNNVPDFDNQMYSAVHEYENGAGSYQGTSRKAGRINGRA